MKTVALFDDTKEPKCGAHVEKKDDVFYIQCEKLKIETHDREELVGVDGEVTLKTPVELECLRGAFSTFAFDFMTFCAAKYLHKKCTRKGLHRRYYDDYIYRRLDFEAFMDDDKND